MAEKVQAPVTSTASLKTEEVLEPIDRSWNELLTQEGIDDVWRKLSYSYKDENPRLYSILENHKPVLVSEKSLLIKLKSKLQESELINERSKLVNYLRRALKNAQLVLEFEVSLEDDDGPQKAYTAADKFRLMMEKNPDLMQFKKAFGLDLE